MHTKNKRLIHYVILLSMIAYVILDLKNSALVGNSNSNRTSVYAMIGVLLLISGIRNFFRKQRYFTHTEIALLLIVAWIIVSNIFMLNLQWTAYIHMGLSLLWYLLYNYFCNYEGIGLRDQKITRIYFVLILCIYVVALLSSSIQMRGESERDDVVLNTAYYVLIFLPVVLTFKNKFFKVFATAIIAFCIFWTFKRGAIVAFFAMLLCYYYTQKRLGAVRSGLFKFLVISVILLVFMGIVDRYSGGIISERFSWDSLQDGSGRNDLYASATTYLRSCDFLTILVGKGAGATARILGGSAHNEWLEFIICYGAIGALLYFNLLATILGRYLYFLKHKMPNASAVGMLLTYWVCVSMYGAFYFIQSTIFVVSMLGFYSQKWSESV